MQKEGKVKQEEIVRYALKSAGTLLLPYRFTVTLLGFSSLYRISRMGEGPGSNGGGDFFTLEKSKISRFFKLENFQKMLKKQWKIYNF